MFTPAPRHAVPAAPAHTASRVPWWFVWPSLIVVVAPAFYALAYCQHRLFADLMPWAPDVMTYGLSGMVDLFGIVTGVYWLRSDDPMMRRWARVFTIAAVIGSTVLTCWAIGRLSGPVPAVLGALPAFVVFALTKLVTMRQAQQAQTRDTLGEAAAQVAAAEAERDALLLQLQDAVSSAASGAAEDTGPLPVVAAAPRGRVSNISDKAPKKERARAFVLAYRERHGRSPTGREVDAEVGGSSTGRSVLAAMRKAGEIPPAEAA